MYDVKNAERDFLAAYRAPSPAQPDGTEQLAAGREMERLALAARDLGVLDRAEQRERARRRRIHDGGMPVAAVLEDDGTSSPVKTGAGLVAFAKARFSRLFARKGGSR